jgi:hypothetical protein
MADLQDENKAEIVPVPPNGSMGELVQGDFGRYTIKVRDVDAAGKFSDFGIALPTDPKWQMVMIRAALLKRTTWKNFDVPTIIHAVIYADQMGLDIMAGDVYMATEGRLSTTAGAKIRHAMAGDKIAGYTIEITDGPPHKFKFTNKGAAETLDLPNYHAKVTVRVKNWDAPMVYETDLSEWFEGRNPNWRTRPKYMLRRNALSKALEEVAPMGVEADEAPPVAKELPEQTYVTASTSSQSRGGFNP